MKIAEVGLWKITVQEQEHGVGEPERELAFIWSHKTKELPVTSPGPPTAMLDGGWGVREWQCVCEWGGRDTTLKKKKTDL